MTPQIFSCSFLGLLHGFTTTIRRSVAITAFPRALRDRDGLDGTLAALQHASCFALGLILTERLLLGRSAAHSVAKTRTFAVRRNRQANPGIENRLTYGSSTRTRTRP